uniref:Uncharacterized protein n=1 Tax=Anguilla anguilla TaxID=7936 RepID=A0A0E9QW46_ANGAN
MGVRVKRLTNLVDNGLHFSQPELKVSGTRLTT